DYSTKTNIPTELNVQGYQFGSSSGYFDDVEDHPKWTILSRKAYDTASTLATIEVAAEALIAMLTAQANVDAGWQNIVGGIGSTGGGTNWPGYAIQMAIATAIGAAMGIQAVVFNYGKYRHQWQETFRNLGRGSNFASYYYSKGHYNYLLPIQEPGNSVRSLQSVKNIKDGRYEINNRISKNSISVNNIDREWGTFVDLGDNNSITYPSLYSNYD